MDKLAKERSCSINHKLHYFKSSQKKIASMNRQSYSNSKTRTKGYSTLASEFPEKEKKSIMAEILSV